MAFSVSADIGRVLIDPSGVARRGGRTGRLQQPVAAYPVRVEVRGRQDFDDRAVLEGDAGDEDRQHNADVGRDVAELQADPALSNVPVVFLTARAQEADLDWGWSSGAAAYITKPFAVPAFVDLIRRLDDLIDQGAEITPAVLRPCRMPNAPQGPCRRRLDVGS